MKISFSILASVLILASAPAFAMSHGGGKMDDKKVDCTKAENKDNKACKAAPKK